MYPGKDDLNEALQLLAIGQKDDARRRLREIVRRRPSFLQAWKVLADNAENPRERAEAIRRAQLLAPGDSWVVEAKKHRMPPPNAPFANPLGGPPSPAASEAPHPADVTVASSRNVRPESPAAAPRVTYDEPTIERPLSAGERARYLGERIPDPEPNPLAPPGPPTQPGLPRYTPADEPTTERFATQRPPEDPYSVPPPTPPSSTRRRPNGEEPTDEFTFISAAKPPADPEPAPPETPAVGQHGTLPYIPREDLDAALTRATSSTAPEPEPEPTPESLDAADVGLTIRSTRLSELDAYAERLADDQPSPTVQRRFTQPEPLDDHLAMTVATHPVTADAIANTTDAAPELDENSEPTGVAPWMIIAVAGLAVFGCLLLIAAFATTLVGG